MLGLNGALSVASQALQAQYAGLSVTNNNIANVNTPGYSRQIVSLSAQASAVNGVSVDAGVSYDGYSSVRDSVLNASINDKTSAQASLTAQSALLAQVNGAFASSTSGIGAGMSSLFSSLSALSTNPADNASRQAVLTSANQLASTFHQGAAALSSATSSANQQITSTVAKINELATQIATLNGQLAQVDATGANGGSLQDQRDQAMTQLAGLTGISTIQTDATPTVTMASGSPLVLGVTVSRLQIANGAAGFVRIVDANGNDITASLTGGTLGGLLAARDSTLPTLSNQLDTLASQFSDAMNSAQAAGTDATGASGSPLFSNATGSGAAANMEVALTDPRGIAVSSDGSSGSSGNLSRFLAVQTSALPSGLAPGDAYASLVYNVGAAGARVSSDLSATTASLTQLTSQRDSQSGVSVDEEATNLIRFQQGYTAAARVISTLTQCYSVLMNMGSGS